HRLADRVSHRHAGAALEFDERRPRGLRLLEDLLLHRRGEPGPLLQRQPRDGGAGPGRHHAVAVLAEDDSAHPRPPPLQPARHVSSTVPRPRTRCHGRPARCTARYVSTSTGLLTTTR